MISTGTSKAECMPVLEETLFIPINVAVNIFHPAGKNESLNVELKEHDVAIFNDIFFSFLAVEAFFFNGLLRTKSE